MGIRVLEYMHELKKDDLICRVWGKVVDDWNETEIIHQRMRVKEIFERHETCEDAARAIGDLHFVNAVEVKHASTGHGLLVYPDWP